MLPAILDHLSAVEGAISTRLGIATGSYSEGSAWRLRVINEETAAALQRLRAEASEGERTAPARTLPGLAKAIISQLALDGRTPYAASGWSHHAWLRASWPESFRGAGNGIPVPEYPVAGGGQRGPVPGERALDDAGVLGRPGGGACPETAGLDAGAEVWPESRACIRRAPAASAPVVRPAEQLVGHALDGPGDHRSPRPCG